MLKNYDEKRDFARTPEPAAGRPVGGEGPLLFIVQKHAARSLHYDLRLESGGALKSWAVPGGPSLDPQVRRLAVRVEDHPLEYASFEGVIPSGEYGAGQVIVWDCGDYSPDEGGLSFGDRAAAEARVREGLEKGKLSITLRGRKLKGSWTLVRMKRGQDWLLIKHRDSYAGASRDILAEDASVLSGATIEDLKAGKEKPARAAVTGRRSADWLKVKAVQTDDFIVGGYTQGTGNRAGTFGSLLLGYYDQDKKLIPAGHVGTGFDRQTLEDLKKRLDAIKAEESPFAVMPEINAPVTWLRPETVIEVKFAEKTRDGRLRAPVYLRLRDDKPAAQVRFTDPDPPPPAVQNQDNGVADVLKQLRGRRNELAIEVEGHHLNLSNLDKTLWPASGKRKAVTKRGLLVYLATVSPYLLRHLRDRPLTLSRYPDGVGGEQFFQKHWSDPLPDFVETAMLKEHHQQSREYLLCNNLPTLLWLGQVADLELHTWFSRVSPGPDRALPKSAGPKDAADSMADYPDFMVFDLDPYVYAGTESKGEEPALNREGFAAAGRAAGWIKELLDGFGWSSYIKTSGKTGLHIYVPLLRQFDFHAVHSAAKTICQYVFQKHPKEITIEWAVEKRPGKVFLDYNQNVRGKTLISIYSPRASRQATISTPLRWDELGAVYPTDFTIFNLPERLARLGDLWADILEKKNDLKGMLESSKVKSQKSKL